jgi:NADH dehydrogenase (ubiquinone) Fe-S protein 3
VRQIARPCARSFTATRLARGEELLKVPVVNPADKYKAVSEDIHAYGQYLIAAMPKFVQQFS